MPRNGKRFSRGASRGNSAPQPGVEHSRPPRPGRKSGPGSGRDRPSDYAAYEREEATREYMSRLFAVHGFAVGETELDRFWAYYQLLRERNAQLDLTRIMGIEATVLKHFIDCAIVADLLELTGPLLDIGSGPGFPGAPIAIRRPGLPVILAESRGKRVKFLEELRLRLGLENVSIYGKSVRDDSPFTPAGAAAGGMQVGGVITRAVEAIAPTLERIKNFLPPGGKAIFMKGPNCGQEVTDAQQGLKGIFKMSDDIRYCLPGTSQQRRLVAFVRREE